MSEKKTKHKLTPSIKRKLLRLVLRSFPFFGGGPELYDLLGEIRRSRSDLDLQISEAMEALRRSSELVSRLEEGLKERSQKLTELQKEYERYSKLAEIEEKKSEALIRQLELTLGKERGRERLFGILSSLMVGLLFFIGGVLFSEPLRSWFNSISKAILGG